MPEGDTIWRTAAALRPRLAGRRVTRAAPARLARLAGRLVEGVDAQGKHLLIRFEGGLGLHTHMRMTGSWHVYAPGVTWQRPRRQMVAMLEIEGGTQAVCFNAPVVELTRESPDASPTGHLGPDILAATLDLEGILARVPHSDEDQLGMLLLDQRVCAGIGNIYRCETLWALGLDPWTLVTATDGATLRRCYEVARELMRAALPGPGSTRTRAVHGRRRRPCQRCGTAVATRRQGAAGRITYWCPGCQRSSTVAVSGGGGGAAAGPQPDRR